jgi:hypothetical protein
LLSEEINIKSEWNKKKMYGSKNVVYLKIKKNTLKKYSRYKGKENKMGDKV